MRVVLVVLAAVAAVAGATSAARLLAYSLDGREVANLEIDVPRAGAVELWPAMQALVAGGKMGMRHRLFGDAVVVSEINGEAHDFLKTGWILSIRDADGGVLRNQAVKGAALREGGAAVWQMYKMSEVPPVDSAPVAAGRVPVAPESRRERTSFAMEEPEEPEL